MVIAEEVTPTATLVAALLEHQRLLALASSLDSFTAFFRDAGTLIYLLIARIGAVAHSAGILSLHGQVVTQGFELWHDPNNDGY